MTPIEQRDACLCFFEPSDPESKEAQRALLTELAKVMRFRVIFLQRQPLAVKAGYLSQRIETPGLGGFKTTLIRLWLFYRHRPLLTRFLSGAGIPNEEGMVESNSTPTPAESLALGVKALLESFPHRYVGLYLGYLLSAEGDVWQALPEALERCAVSIPDLLVTADKG